MRQLHWLFKLFLSEKGSKGKFHLLCGKAGNKSHRVFKSVDRITLFVSSVAMLSNEEMCRGGVQFTPIAATLALLSAQRTHSAKSSPPQVVLSVVRACLISCYRWPLSNGTFKRKAQALNNSQVHAPFAYRQRKKTRPMLVANPSAVLK
jgi:hypothetical protein